MSDRGDRRVFHDDALLEQDARQSCRAVTRRRPKPGSELTTHQIETTTAPRVRPECLGGGIDPQKSAFQLWPATDPPVRRTCASAAEHSAATLVLDASLIGFGGSGTCVTPWDRRIVRSVATKDADPGAARVTARFLLNGAMNTALSMTNTGNATAAAVTGTEKGAVP